MHDARDLTRHLAELLRREHAALADFLVALAAFDRDERWRDLGHVSLFYFLHRELGLSKSAAFYRKTAAELVQRYPEIVQPLKDGRLCLSSVTELAKVITPENQAEVLPRFFHASKSEAKAIAAELNPAEAPAHRVVVTAVAAPTRAAAVDSAAVPAVLPEEPPTVKVEAVASTPVPPQAAPRAEVQPLTADLRRFHLTVTKRFLTKLQSARDALSHSHPGAGEEVVLEAALDLLLEKHARRKGLVKKPSPAPAKPSERPRHIPAAVKRQVWTRDEGRCQYELKSGQICGSTHRLELDHVVPVARGGPSTVENLRVVCAGHNKLAARDLFGAAWMDQFGAPASGDRKLRRPTKGVSFDGVRP
jgi:hypothetical protein